MMTDRDWSDANALAEKIRNAIAVPVTRQDELFVMLVAEILRARQSEAALGCSSSAARPPMTPRLSSEHEAEIARAVAATTQGADNEGPDGGQWVVGVPGGQWIADFDRNEDVNWFLRSQGWVPALLAELRALREERDAAVATFRGACRVLRALALVATGHEDPGNRITLSTANETYQQDIDEIMRCLLRAQRVGLAGLDDLRRLSEAATPGQVGVDDLAPYKRGIVLRTEAPANHYGVIVASLMTKADATWIADAVNYVRALLVVDPSPTPDPYDDTERSGR